MMNRAELEAQLVWSPAYDSRWDGTPDEYANNDLVGWGRSRRLARVALPARAADPGFKAYLGVQHVDPGRAGWTNFAAPEARFFLSWFAGPRCLGLRTYPTLDAARDELWRCYLRHLLLFSPSTASLAAAP